MQRRQAAIAVLAAVLFVGWTGAPAVSLGPGPGAHVPGTTATGVTQTSTPNRTSTTTAGVSNDTLPPGVAPSGVTDPSALVDAHRRGLNETGFSFRFRANVTVGPASQWTVQRGTVAAGLSPLVVTSTSERDLDDRVTRVATDLWANRTTTAVRYHRHGRTSVRLYDHANGSGVPDETWAHLPRADLESQVTNAWLLELALTAGEYELVGVERRDGRRFAVLRATEAAAAANLTDLDATVVVDGEGRVHSLRLSAAYAGDGTTTRIRYAFELTDLGPVAVHRPPWVADAVTPDGNGTTTSRPSVNPPRSSHPDASVGV